MRKPLFSPIHMAFFTFAALALLVFLVFHNLNRFTLYFGEDQALSFAVAKTILSGDSVLLGPPSHLGGRHLGPVYYYFVSLLLWVSGGQTAEALWLSSLVMFSGVVLSCLLAVLLVPLPRRLLAPVFVLLCMSASNYVMNLRLHWHGYFLFIPSCLFILSSYSTMLAGPAALPLYILCASILIQTHYSAAPLIAAFSVVVPFAWKYSSCETWISKKLRQPGLQSLFLLLAILSWLPMLRYEIFYGSNLAVLASQQGMAFAAAGFKESFVCLMSFLINLGFKGLLLGYTNHHISILLSFALWVFVSILIARISKRRDPCGCMWMAILLSLLIYLPVLAFQPAPLSIYYLNALLPLPACAVGAACISAFDLLETPRRRLRILARLFLFLAAFSFIVGAWQNFERYRKPSFSPFASVAHVEDIAHVIREDQKQPSPVDIYAYNQAAASHDGYSYFLEGFSRMHYHDLFPENAALSGNSPAERAYLIACPFLTERFKKNTLKQLHATWPNVRGVAPTSYGGKTCMMWRLEK